MVRSFVSFGFLMSSRFVVGTSHLSTATYCTTATAVRSKVSEQLPRPRSTYIALAATTDRDADAYTRWSIIHGYLTWLSPVVVTAWLAAVLRLIVPTRSSRSELQQCRCYATSRVIVEISISRHLR